MTDEAIYTSAAFENASGLSVAAGASVEVRKESDNSLATLWDNRAGTNDIGNPITADSNGRFEFYIATAEDGYKITVTSGSDSQTLRYQHAINSGASYQTGTGTEHTDPGNNDKLATLQRMWAATGFAYSREVGLDDGAKLLDRDDLDSRYARTEVAETFEDNVTVQGNLVVTGATATFEDVVVNDNITAEEMVINHTAETTGDNALEITIDAAGFDNIRGFDIDYVTGTLMSGEDISVIAATVDETDSTGGEVRVLDISRTNDGGAETYGVSHGVGVNPIIHESGTFGDMDEVDNNGSNDLAAFLSTGTDVTIFAADNDYVIIGDAAQFNTISFFLDTFADNPGIKPTFEYSTGSGTWATFSPIDGTNGMRQNGNIRWSLSSISGSWMPGTSGNYLIRITRTQNSLSTAPVEDQVQISAATEYAWDKDGNVNLRTMALSEYLDLTPILDGNEPTPQQGRIFYSDEEDSPSFYDNNGVEIHMGQDLSIRAKNVSGAQIDKGEAVYISGSSGQNPEVDLARSDSFLTAQTIGLMSRDTSNNGVSKVFETGLLRNVDTSAYTAGDILYLSAVTAGALTTTQPQAPNLAIRIGYVVVSSATEGAILIDIDYELNNFTQDSILYVGSTGKPIENNPGLTYDGTDMTLGGNINLSNSSAIQDAGTNAIEFDGSGVATFPQRTEFQEEIKLTDNQPQIIIESDNDSDVAYNIFRDSGLNTVGRFITRGMDGLGAGYLDIDNFDKVELNVPLDMGSSSAIQDAGTNMLQGDGSGNTSVKNQMAVNYSGSGSAGTEIGNPTLAVFTENQFVTSDATQSGLDIVQVGGTTGNGNYGGAIKFSKIANIGAMAAIASKQTSADSDQGGAAFFAHDTTTNDFVLSEAGYYDHNLDWHFNGNINLSNSSAIQDAGTNMIVPDGSGVAGLPNGATFGGGTDVVDAYEEKGTSTVTMTALTSGTITMNSSYDTFGYTKIGDLISGGGWIRVSSVSSPTGHLRIDGLPEAVASATTDEDTRRGVTISSTGAVSENVLEGFLVDGTTFIEVRGKSGGDFTEVADEMQAGTQMHISFSYPV